MKINRKRSTSPLEEADLFARMLSLRDANGRPKYTIRTLAIASGNDKSYIEDLLFFTRVAEDIRTLIEDKPNIPPRIVRELQRLATPEERAPLITAIKQGNLTIADVRDVVREQIRTYPVPPPSPLDEAKVRRRIKRMLKRGDNIVKSIIEEYQQQVDHMSEEEKAILRGYLKKWIDDLNGLIQKLQ